MATQDNNPGLLSKMVRFVRNPTKDWTELNGPDSIPVSDFGKEALKQVIDGKRHDDAIRKREFHHLRKMRQASPAVKAELSLDTSTFRSSLGGAESDLAGRSSTLKKIDEIEAQMSRQWWKSAPGTIPAPKAALTPETSTDTGQSSFPATWPSKLALGAGGQATNLPNQTGNQEFQATVPGLGQLHAAGEYLVSTHSTFSPSKMVSLDMVQNLSDPEMEEAAIRYANGDDAGAEAALQVALKLTSASPEKAIRWASALLDLYRCIGQQNNFERLAIDYAQRFGRSPPAWPAQQAFPTSVASPSNVSLSELKWDCPAILDEATVNQLRQMVCLSTVTYVLNWAAVKEISISATASLTALFTKWCQSDLTVRLEGDAALDYVTRTLAPNGDKTVSHQLWQLRFEALRLLDLQDDYEMAALEFCVTFELSPPAWRDPVCKRLHAFQSNLPANNGENSRWKNSAQGSIFEDGVQVFSAQLTMSNEILGDVSNLIEQWKSLPKSEDTLVVSCAALIRVDFSAAGGLLNWVANLTTQGSRVEFHDVPRLVASFFNLIGINEHAKVISRAN
jgi:ABC-type transporter Mla MlaB component